jgi:hypothetical protein
MLTVSGMTPVRTGIENAISNGITFAEEKNELMSDFYLHRVKNTMDRTDTILQFTQVAGRALLVKATATFPDLSLAAKCGFDNGHQQFVCFPTNQTKKRLRVPVVTDHRNDWEIIIDVEPGKPITFTVLQKGVIISTEFLSRLK